MNSAEFAEVRAALGIHQWGHLPEQIAMLNFHLCRAHFKKAHKYEDLLPYRRHRPQQDWREMRQQMAKAFGVKET